MIFNSPTFLIFFAIVFLLYLLLKHRHIWQNRMLLVASYVFYGAWDWRFLLIVLTVTVLDYIYGKKIHEARNNKNRKLFMFLSVLCNLSILGVFKYFDFFSGSLQVLLSHLGLSIQPHFIQIILPVGISFYIFKTISA